MAGNWRKRASDWHQPTPAPRAPPLAGSWVPMTIEERVKLVDAAWTGACAYGRWARVGAAEAPPVMLRDKVTRIGWALLQRSAAAASAQRWWRRDRWKAPRRCGSR